MAPALLKRFALRVSTLAEFLKAKNRRIGVLMSLPEGDADTKVRIEALRQGLGTLGWSEGRNVRIDYRFAPAGARAQALAKELVALQPDVIVSNASPATGALQRETRTIPIVFVAVADPIGSGFVASLAQPGANITGFLLFEASITGKWLAMLRDTVPALARATLVINPKTAAYYEYYLRAAQAAASSLGIELVFGPIGMRTPRLKARSRRLRARRTAA